ncbi:MAG: outer rane autotransporter barrel domain protein [Burkholderiaceae bacterium]|nr:outer rane autotransporter barrel domain protein [Burkholderiaceae bacterium]
MNSLLRLGGQICLLLVLMPVAHGKDWHELVQPIGNLMAVESAATVNGRLGGFPPFETSTDVTTIQTGVPQYFVRFYNPTSAENPSNPVGSWVMRSATVRGLTPAQVRDLFALPAMPTMMTMVLVPAGSNLYTGIAAPIAGWGAGGGQQSKLIGPPWVSADNFMNRQAIGDCILCYRTLAPNGNANRVASYLDARIPTAYSDLETVYTNLDLLYYPPTAPRFNQALNQISPQRYDHLAIDAVNASVLHNDAIDQRVAGLLFGDRSMGLSPDENEPKRRNVWLQAAGSSMRAPGSGFSTHSSGIVAGTDARISDNGLLGFSAGIARNDLNWNGGMGGVNTDYAKAGIYAVWNPGNWFAQGGVNAGISHGDATRRLAFAALSRNATASTSGWEGNVHLRFGYRLPYRELDLVPAISLDYFYQRQGSFSESGADSLNLRVQSVKYRTLRSNVGVSASWKSILPDGQLLMPRLQLGWVHERPLDNRAITAQLNGQPDSFTVYGDTKSTDAISASLGFSLISGKHCSLFARYNLEYRRNFTEQALSAGLNYRF